MGPVITVLRCPNCAAPLPSGLRGEVLCAYCRHVLVYDPGAAGYRKLAGDEGPPDDGLLRVHVDGHTFALLGRLAQGDGSDVFLARRGERLAEMVVLKVLRAREDEDLLRNEWRTLTALHGSEAHGAEFFARMIPQLVAHGPMTGGPQKLLATAYRWRSGFVHTLGDVLRAYPRGVDPRAAVWMWRRALELVGWVHRAGYAHGALIPAHLLIHPRDHGLTFVGWGTATPLRGERLPALPGAARAFYPDDLWGHRVPSPASDLVTLARTIACILGGDPGRGTVPSSVPAALADLVVEYAGRRRCEGMAVDAWALNEQVAKAARVAFGHARYVAFTMPD